MLGGAVTGAREMARRRRESRDRREIGRSRQELDGADQRQRADAGALCRRRLATLEQGEEVTMHRSLGDLQAFRRLRDAELLAGQGDCLQHVEGDLDRPHTAVETLFHR
jgi:hypothetical protein